MLLNRFNELTQEFSDSKVAVHAITAEPGTEAELRDRLTKAGLPELKYPVISNPSWSLMTLKPKDQIYVPGNPDPKTGYSHPAGLAIEGPKKYCDPYHMVQPAVVIVDRAGEVVSWWSWSKLQEGKLYPGGHADPLDPKDTGKVPNARSEANPTGNTHDVRWRPVPKDILSRLKEGGGDLENVLVDNIGAPKGKDHANPIGLNPPGVTAKL